MPDNAAKDNDPYDNLTWLDPLPSGEVRRPAENRDNAPVPVQMPPHIERLWRDVGDDSPWYDKALWVAIAGLVDAGDTRTLARIERLLDAR